MNYRYLFFIIYFLCFPVNAQGKTILILGDSISAAYKIPVEKGWVALLEQRLKTHEYDYTVVNASVVGETTFGAVNRLPGLLEKFKPEVVLIELGGNDGLMGITLDDIKINFIEMIDNINQADSVALLIPMQIPPNYGASYARGFSAIYEQVAEITNTPVSEFMFKGFAEDLEMMQPDGIHPVESAQIIMLDNVWPSLHKQLKGNKHK